jgi:hypothetical protein
MARKYGEDQVLATYLETFEQVIRPGHAAKSLASHPSPHA